MELHPTAFQAGRPEELAGLSRFHYQLLQPPGFPPVGGRVPVCFGPISSPDSCTRRTKDHVCEKLRPRTWLTGTSPEECLCLCACVSIGIELDSLHKFVDILITQLWFLVMLFYLFRDLKSNFVSKLPLNLGSSSLSLNSEVDAGLSQQSRLLFILRILKIWL